jgi:hypothetical protein
MIGMRAAPWLVILVACDGPGGRATADGGAADVALLPDSAGGTCGFGDGPWRALGDGPLDEAVVPGGGAQQIAVAARPGLTVAWTTLVDQDSAARVALWDGSAWQALGDAVSTPGFAGGPALARHADQTVLTLADFREADGIEHTDVLAFRSRGGAWTPLGGGSGQLSWENAPGEYRPRAAFDQAGDPVVAFAQFADGSGPGTPLPWRRALTTVHVGVGATTTELPPAPGWEDAPAHVVALLADDQQLVLVATLAGLAAETRVWRRAAGAWVASPAGGVTGAAEAATLTPDGDVLVLLRDGRVMRLGEQNWSSAGPALPGPFLWAELASDLEGQPIVAATALVDGSYRITVRRLASGTWDPVGEPLVDQALQGAATAIATDACGRPLVAVMTWPAGGDGDVRVWFWGDAPPRID